MASLRHWAVLGTALAAAWLLCTTSTVARSPTEAARAWLEALRVVPGTVELVLIDDLARLRAVRGATPPTDGAPLAEIEAYRQALLAGEREAPTLATGQLSGLYFAYAALTDSAMWQQLFGFTVASVEQEVLASTSDGPQYWAVRGRFAPGVVGAALRSGGLSAPVDQSTYAGRELYRWGEDFHLNLAGRSPANPLGQSWRIAAGPTTVLRTRASAHLEQMLDCERGVIVCFPDLPTTPALVDAMTDFGVYAAALSARPLSPAMVRPDATPIGGPMLQPYEAVAVGTGADDRGPLLAIALLHASPAAAAANVPLLEERFRSAGPRASLLGSAVAGPPHLEVRGRALVARVDGERAASLWREVLSSGLLLAAP